MSLNEIETLIKQLQEQVNLNTVAIQSLSNRLLDFTPLGTFYSVNSKVDSQSSIIQDIKNQVATLTIDLNSVNKLAYMLDTNVKDAQINDILQFDGDRWTNIKPANIISGGGITKLEELSDVKIQNKADKQALCWDNITSKWINHTITGGSSGGGGLDIAAMWTELGKDDTTQSIHPSHIKGYLPLSGGTVKNLTIENGLTTNGAVTLTNGTTVFNLLSTGISINGSLKSTGEITAYKIA